MKSIEKYQDEISGKIFDTEKEAIASEEFSMAIQDTFSFYESIEDEDCIFVNGGYTIQRNKEFYNKIADGIVDLTKRYHPWISKQMPTLCRKNITGFIGGYLDDGNSPLYKWWCILGNICKECYREHGQKYYANNCTHTDKKRGGDEKMSCKYLRNGTTNNCSLLGGMFGYSCSDARKTGICLHKKTFSLEESTKC